MKIVFLLLVLTFVDVTFQQSSAKMIELEQFWPESKKVSLHFFLGQTQKHS